MAASLLEAVEMPELITHSIEEYEQLAVKIATHPSLQKTIQNKLEENIKNSRLFNTDQFRDSIEIAYEIAYQNAIQNLPQKYIYVDL
jgi:predicted O-linked N-acetylglucosamine transferase (SPINDLY family)